MAKVEPRGLSENASLYDTRPSSRVSSSFGVPIALIAEDVATLRAVRAPGSTAASPSPGVDVATMKGELVAASSTLQAYFNQLP